MDCKKAKEKLWIHYKPSLFQHIGTHSSLKGKVQKLKDKQFGKVELFKPHQNPPAVVTTSIKPYKSFTLEKAYRGESFFWGLLPQQGDELCFVFTEPVLITHYLFRSGNVEHPSDRFYKTTVEVLPEKSPAPGAVLYKASNTSGYLIVGMFDELGVAEGSVAAGVGRVKAVALRVQAESDNWAIISEVGDCCGERHVSCLIGTTLGTSL
ncbi:hypothetical protein HAZT_HAZT005093 [Hyalella azteca]|uniref:MGAT4 A/B/C C-terminal domain-containing protein n=1 Tax=Hyalella azteca TaxID=294128 RepID=A0A6A0GY49_HYAAZ|nr:hypothetical protein HAZT_HAZT005093 [Hyalella azteca]